MDYSVLQDIGFRTGRKTAAVVVTETCLDAMLSRVFPAAAPVNSYDMLDQVLPVGEVELPGGSDIDLVDPATSRIVWRGWADETLDGAIDNQRWMEQRIDQAVSKILARLPPRP